MDRLQVVMPMAGLGERFSKAGFTVPKPLIQVDGKPMFVRALDSINSLMTNADLTVVLRKEMDDQWHISAEIKHFFPNAKICLLQGFTNGAAETVSLALETLASNASMLVMDCDIYFKNNEFALAIQETEKFKYDGALISFKSDDSRYSYVKKNGHIATEVIEKVVISDNAIAGGYFFKTVSLFQFYFHKILKERFHQKQSEIYISNVVQAAISDGKLFKVFPVVFESFGTPEELESYKNRIKRNNS